MYKELEHAIHMKHQSTVSRKKYKTYNKMYMGPASDNSIWTNEDWDTANVHVQWNH